MPELNCQQAQFIQEFGQGIPVVLTTGGRWAGYVHRVVGELAKIFIIFTWDRNTDGKSKHDRRRHFKR